MSKPVPDLHELANRPGAGLAFKELLAAGFIGSDPTAPEWSVLLVADVHASTRITVRANSAREACEVAEAIWRHKDLNWEFMTPTNVDPVDAECRAKAE